MSPIILVGLLLCLMQGSVAAAARLAIIPDAANVRPVADLLTVALSSSASVELVERAELDRVLAEQVRASGGKDNISLGRTLRADGLLLLSLSGVGTNQSLNLRLLAVQHGVVLRQFSATWPQTNMTAWAGEMVQRLAPWWPKLTVLKKDAVPISILNLRSAVRTTEAVGLERELTTLLHHRLSQHPEVFVLERRRLELLAEEKELSGDNNSFWSGGYLLDGVINRDRYDPVTVTIHGQLQPANQATKTALELTGTRTNLPALIDELARRILAVTKSGMVLKEWNPSEEAAQFWDEAQWAAKWGIWREAQAASEASWALGRQDKDVAALRVRAWQQTGKDYAACSFELERVLVNYSAPPSEDGFADMLRAADLFEAGWKEFAAAQTPMDAKWFELGVAVVTDLSAWLRHYYFMPEAREGQDLPIQQAQQQADRICRLLVAHQGYLGFAKKSLLAQVRALWGSLWVQTPEAGLKLYRELQAAGEWSLVRKRFLNSFCFAQEDASSRRNGWPEGFYDPASPLLTGWKWGERQNWPRVWSRFVEEWCASDDPLLAVEGRYLRCAFAWSGEDYERELRELLNIVWEKRDVLAQANLIEGLVGDLRWLAGKRIVGETVPNRLAGLTAERRTRIEKELWPEFQKKIDEFARSKASRDKQLQLMTDAKNYFTTRNDFDFSSFARWQVENFEPNEAGELLPLVKEYKRRLSELPAGTLRGRGWSNIIGRFEASLQATATGVPIVTPARATNSIANQPPATNRSAFSAGSPGGMRPPGFQPGGLPGINSDRFAPAIELTTVGATNYFRDAKFWRPDRKKFRSWQVSDLAISDVIYREGKLWAEVLFQEVHEYTYSRTDRIVVCAIDPDTLVTEMIEVELDQGGLQRAFFTRTGERHYEIFQNALYFNVGGKLRRYPFSKRRWEAVPVPVEGAVRLGVVQDRLYLCTSDSIMVLNTGGDGAEILASIRRRPAQNVLDQVEQLGKADIFSGPTGAVCVAIQNKVWAYSPTKKNWEVMLEIPALVVGQGIGGDGIYYGTQSQGQDEEFHFWFAGMSAPESMLLQPPDPRYRLHGGMPIRQGRLEEVASLPKVRWELPARIRPLTGVTALASNQLWSFVGAIAIQSDQGAPVIKEVNGRQGLLFGFDYHRKDPLIIPLKLEVPRDLVSGQELNSLVGAGSFGTTLFRATPVGLILTHHRLPGFWLLPQAELERQARDWLHTPPFLIYPAQTNLNTNFSRP